jgi:hypothetical protein
LSRELPAGTRRLFSGYASPPEAELPAALLFARLLEDGDPADLAWLFQTFPEADVAAWLERHGARQLSTRSRAFWGVVLGGSSASDTDPETSRNDLWLL